MTALRSATELATAASQPYPNDSAEYRQAHTALLAEEVEQRRHIERMAAQRRALPPGGEAPDPTPLWNILDLTPAERGVDWYPKPEYPATA